MPSGTGEHVSKEVGMPRGTGGMCRYGSDYT